MRLGPLPPIHVSGGTLVTVVLLAVIVYPGVLRAGLAPGASAAVAGVIGLGVIVSVLVHEAAHAVTARAFGAQVDQIALTLWGGHTRYRAVSMGWGASVVVSLAGPAANALLAGAAHLALPLSAGAPAVAVVLGYSVLLNVGLAVFNLLPGLPMDGGRAVEALLGGLTGRRELGTRITAWIGRGIAVLVVGLPLLRILRDPGSGSVLLLVWAVVIATTLWQGASAALADARISDRVRRLDVPALTRPVAILAGASPVTAVHAGIDPAGVLVLDERGRAGRLDPSALAAVPADAAPSTPLRAVAGPPVPVTPVPADIGGDDLVAALVAEPRALRLLVDAAGTPVGLVDPDDVARALRLR